MKKLLKKRHTILMWFWILMIPVSIFTPLKESITFVILLSLYANIESSAAAKEAKDE